VNIINQRVKRRRFEALKETLEIALDAKEKVDRLEKQIEQLQEIVLKNRYRIKLIENRTIEILRDSK